MEQNTKQDTKADKLAKDVKKLGMFAGSYRLVKAIGFSVLLIALSLYFLYLGIPSAVSAVMIFIALTIVVLEILSLKRISGVNLSLLNEEGSDIAELEEGEVLNVIIPAVMQYGKIRSVGVLGTGKVLTPENTLIVTNKSIWALTVAFAGGDKVISGADIGQWQWTTAYQDIIDKINQMITSLTLDEVFKQCKAKHLMRLEDIKSAKTLPMTYAISLTRKDGKKFGYSVRLKEDYERAKKIFNIN